MSRHKLIEELKQKNPKLVKKEIEKIIDIFSKSIEKALIEGKKVELRGFGTFFIKQLKENYAARNPSTGELVYVPKRNKVRFKASKKLKEIINKWKNLRFLLPVIQQT